MQRLYVACSFKIGGELSLNFQQMHYLQHVLRLKENDKIIVFNGQDGEWLASIENPTRKTFFLRLLNCVKSQASSNEEVLEASEIIYCFAPLKHARLDYIVQKAVELNVGRVYCVKTQYTQMKILNEDRVKANIIEAVEQCGRMSLPDFTVFSSLSDLLKQWPKDYRLLFCNEKEQDQQALSFLLANKEQKIGVLIGPEGGFSEEECQLLKGYGFTQSVSLGKLILRADTAAVTILSLVNAVKCLPL